MILPEFVFIKNKEIERLKLILYTRPPFTVCRAVEFETAKQKEDFVIKHNLLNAAVNVPGYHILLCKYGTIHGVRESPILGHHVTKEDLIILEKLKEFYEAERIKGNETRLKKYEIGK